MTKNAGGQRVPGGGVEGLETFQGLRSTAAPLVQPEQHAPRPRRMKVDHRAPTHQRPREDCTEAGPLAHHGMRSTPPSAEIIGAV